VTGSVNGSFFLCDIVFMFCVGVMFQGQYIDDYKWVAKSYVRSGGLLFDMCTSIPVSFVELSVAIACEAALAENQEMESVTESVELRFIRTIKPLRWFKLARIIKLQRVTTLISHTCDNLGIEPRHQRQAMLALWILGVCVCVRARVRG
jgi:hypothetical protein